MPYDIAAPVTENIALGGGYHLTTFDAPGISAAAAPGQFVMIGSDDPSAMLLRRPFSICLAGPLEGPADGLRFTLLYKVVGRCTGFLSRLETGNRAAVLGPLGRGFSMPPQGESAAIVAGGAGIAAFPYLVQALNGRGVRPVLYYGGRTSSDLPLLAWLERRSSRVEVTTDDGSLGRRGLVTEAVEEDLDAGRFPGRLYVCGPHAMMKQAAAIAERHGIACEVALETPMACGYGVCVGCVVEVRQFGGEYGRYRRACVDGPVFDASEIVW